ncbi:MAG: MerR family transcriptional regulator [Gammaproteobacteria bacterium]|nr:MerR family transcriptional regulator [Gammaproteobacteria bacterium]MBL6998918.1 MerR family transcriptional regulator [Gammaproteobacteria bacterium]
MTKQELFSAVIITDDEVISLAELCRSCALSAEQILPIIEYGIIEPLPTSRNSIVHWQFSADCVPRMQMAIRLQRDLDINLAGTALALELLDELKTLRQRVAALQRD